MSHSKHIASLQRRNFLKMIGKAGLSVPLLQASSLGAGMLLSRQAMANEASPRKVIFVYIPDGTPNGASNSFLPDQNLNLKVCSAPLEDVKNECVFCKGVEIIGGGGHSGAQRVLGAFAKDVNVSIDLALEETVGAVSPVASLRLGVRTRNLNPISARSFTPSTDFQDNPQAAFERLFGGAVDASPIGLKRDKKIQEFNLAALEKIKTKLGSYELQRLKQHQAAIEKMQTELNKAATGLVPLGCSNPVYNPGNLSDEQVDSEFTNLFALQTENAILALKCNITRVVTLQMGSDAADFTATGFSEQYHSAIHGGSFDNYAAYRAYFTERVAHLIKRLQEEPDPDGGKLIDSTLVVQVTDMGDGSAHTADDAAFMLAGGGSAVNRGTIVDVPNHHRLLDTVAQYMGVYNEIGKYDPDGLPVSEILA
jgi:hypothetical protein